MTGTIGMDVDDWRRILLSNNFENVPTDLCKAIAKVIKKLCTEKFSHRNLEPFLACRLIFLNKNPGLRLIGVGEILRRISRKVVVPALGEESFHQ